MSILFSPIPRSLEGRFFSAAASTITGTTEQSVFASGVGTKVIPAGWFQPGYNARIVVRGTITTPTIFTGTTTIRVKVAGTTIASSVTTGLLANVTAATFKVIANVQNYTTGPTGTFGIAGDITYPNGLLGLGAGTVPINAVNVSWSTLADQNVDCHRSVVRLGRIDPDHHRNARAHAAQHLDPEEKGHPPMNPSHYAKSILAIAAAAIGILVAALADNTVTTAELVNVGIAVVTAVGVYLIPNLPAGPARYFKSGVALLGAALTALASFITDGVTTAEWLQIALAALAAIGVYVVPNGPAVAPIAVITEGDLAKHVLENDTGISR